MTSPNLKSVHSVGEVVTGVVTRTMPFGLFVRLESGEDALLQIIFRDGIPRTPLPQPGTTLESIVVVITETGPGTMPKIALSRKSTDYERFGKVGPSGAPI
jgi:small subunit ribosomal protein S1